MIHSRKDLSSLPKFCYHFKELFHIFVSCGNAGHTTTANSVFIVFGLMTHLAFLSLFGSFTIAGQENVSTDRRELAEGKLPTATNTQPLVVMLQKTT